MTDTLGPPGLLGLDDQFHRDPYAGYQRLRDHPPVRDPVYGVLLVSRYDDIVEVVRQPAVFSSSVAPAGPPPDMSGLDPDTRRRLSEAGSSTTPVRTLVTADPPDHSRYRALVSRHLGMRRATEAEPVMRTMAERLVDGFVDDGHVELVSAFAGPFPLAVVAMLLGMADGEDELLRKWADDAAEVIGNPPAVIERSRRGIGKRSDHGFDGYCRQQIAERRRHPVEGDLISDLVHSTTDDGRPLSEAELLSILGHFLVAGHETSTKMLTTAIWLLATHPAVMAAVRVDPGLIPNVVEEALRFDAPVQAMFRLATADTTVGGVGVSAGTMVMLLYGSANRDPRHFAEPDRFDPSRFDSRHHLSFGQGAHFCVGAPFARAEGRIGLEVLLGRLKDLKVDRRATAARRRKPSFILRGIEELHLNFRSAENL